MRARKMDCLELRTDPLFLQALDDWRRRQPDAPSRSAAVRRLVYIGLDNSPPFERPREDAPGAKPRSDPSDPEG